MDIYTLHYYTSYSWVAYTIPHGPRDPGRPMDRAALEAGLLAACESRARAVPMDRDLPEKRGGAVLKEAL